MENKPVNPSKIFGINGEPISMSKIDTNKFSKKERKELKRVQNTLFILAADYLKFTKNNVEAQAVSKKYTECNHH